MASGKAERELMTEVRTSAEETIFFSPISYRSLVENNGND